MSWQRLTRGYLAHSAFRMSSPTAIMEMTAAVLWKAGVPNIQRGNKDVYCEVPDVYWTEVGTATARFAADGTHAKSGESDMAIRPPPRPTLSVRADRRAVLRARRQPSPAGLSNA
jgi:hypothetical protein